VVEEVEAEHQQDLLLADQEVLVEVGTHRLYYQVQQELVIHLQQVPHKEIQEVEQVEHHCQIQVQQAEVEQVQQLQMAHQVILMVVMV
jgi:hypothetical protein